MDDTVSSSSLTIQTFLNLRYELICDLYNISPSPVIRIVLAGVVLGRYLPNPNAPSQLILIAYPLAASSLIHAWPPPPKLTVISTPGSDITLIPLPSAPTDVGMIATVSKYSPDMI